MKHIENGLKFIENPYLPMDFKNLKKKIHKPKVSDFSKMFVIPKRKPMP